MTELEAELYALTHRGNPGDLEFYAQACAGAERVLELGAGCGRLLPALSRAAQHVVGLDCEPRFLQAARRRLGRAERANVELVRGDLRTFELGQQFDRVLLPYNALYCLLSRRALEACLRAVRRHLAPQGAFLFDVWCADRFAREPRAGAHRDDRGALVSVLHRGQVWDVFERSRLRSAAQRLDVTYRYVSRERGRSIESRVPQRYARSRELREMLAEAGLRVEAVWGDFFARRFGPGAPHFIVQARHPVTAAGRRAG